MSVHPSSSISSVALTAERSAKRHLWKERQAQRRGLDLAVVEGRNQSENIGNTTSSIFASSLNSNSTHFS